MKTLTPEENEALAASTTDLSHIGIGTSFKAWTQIRAACSQRRRIGLKEALLATPSLAGQVVPTRPRITIGFDTDVQVLNAGPNGSWIAVDARRQRRTDPTDLYKALQIRQDTLANPYEDDNAED